MTSWMSYRDSSSGNVFASTGLRIGKDYAYHIGGKEAPEILSSYLFRGL